MSFRHLAVLLTGLATMIGVSRLAAAQTPEEQPIVNSAAAAKFGAMWDEAEREGKTSMLAKGTQVSTLAKDQLEQMKSMHHHHHGAPGQGQPLAAPPAGL